jgi:hypothetical protein
MQEKRTYIIDMTTGALKHHSRFAAVTLDFDELEQVSNMEPQGRLAFAASNGRSLDKS